MFGILLKMKLLKNYIMFKKFGRFCFRIDKTNKFGGDKRFCFGIELAHTKSGYHQLLDGSYETSVNSEIIFHIGFWSITISTILNRKIK